MGAGAAGGAAGLEAATVEGPGLGVGVGSVLAGVIAGPGEGVASAAEGRTGGDARRMGAHFYYVQDKSIKS